MTRLKGKTPVAEVPAWKEPQDSGGASGSADACWLQEIDGEDELNPMHRSLLDLTHPLVIGDAHHLGMSACDLGAEAMVMEFDVTGPSRKGFLQNPSLFAVNKIRTGEVRYEKLSTEHRSLFDEGKSRELAQYITAEAVKKCVDEEALQTAWDTQRVLKARWVLTWKPVPPEEQEEARQKRSGELPHTTITSDGAKKAKARLVIIGFQHPDLGTSRLKTAAPVQSKEARAAGLQLVAFRQWALQTADASSAFLQSDGTGEPEAIYTSGVPELALALGAPIGEAMEIWRACYGLTTAPRVFWLDFKKKVETVCGGKPILGDPCTWIWTEERDGEVHTVGYVGTHVDDIQIAGDDDSEVWQKAKEQIQKMYVWGAWRERDLRFAGVHYRQLTDGSFLVDQDFYIEGLADLDVPHHRLRDKNATITEHEWTEAKKTLGQLQWLGVQTQPLVCARVGILQSELKVGEPTALLREVQDIVTELRKSLHTVTKIHSFPKAERWDQVQSLIHI